MGGIYKIRCLDGLRWHYVHAKLIKIGSGIQRLIEGYTDIMEIT
jgi:hypothetical protein